jgi:hypothetical protein
LFQSTSSDDGSSFYFNHTIVPTCLDDLTVEARWPKHSSDDSFVEVESVGGDERGNLEIHSIREVAKQVQGVAVAALAHHGRWPKPRPDIDHGEDPHRLFLAPDDRSDLVCLKLYRGEPSYLSITEATTAASCLFQPAMNRIPGNSFDSSDSRLVHTLDTESGDFIKRGVSVLESIIRGPVCRGERLPTSLALVTTTLSPPGLVEAVANDDSEVTFSRKWAVLVGTAETFHGWWTL